MISDVRKKCSPNCIACLALMEPALNVPALEHDGAYDPLDVAMSIDVREGETWRISRQEGAVTVWAIGKPTRGFVICNDYGIERTCRRVNLQGVDVAVVAGIRVRGVYRDPNEFMQSFQGKGGSNAMAGEEKAIGGVHTSVEETPEQAQAAETETPTQVGETAIGGEHTSEVSTEEPEQQSSSSEGGEQSSSSSNDEQGATGDQGQQQTT